MPAPATAGLPLFPGTGVSRTSLREHGPPSRASVTGPLLTSASSSSVHLASAFFPPAAAALAGEARQSVPAVRSQHLICPVVPETFSERRQQVVACCCPDRRSGPCLLRHPAGQGQRSASATRQGQKRSATHGTRHACAGLSYPCPPLHPALAQLAAAPSTALSSSAPTACPRCCK